MAGILRRLLAAAIFLAVAFDAGAQGSSRQVIVSAAVSLTEVLQQLAPMYQMKTGDRVLLNLGSSNTLARQISFGAGPDVFISADEAQMDAVAARIDPASRVDLLSNQLAIAVPDDRPRTMTSARDLLDPAIRRIAIGDPAAVPAGVYAKRYLQMLGIWPDLASRERRDPRHRDLHHVRRDSRNGGDAGAGRRCRLAAGAAAVPGEVARRDGRVASAGDAARGHGAHVVVAVQPAGAARRAARAHRHRNRVHAGGCRDGDGRDGNAAARPHSSCRLRAGDA